MKEPSMKRALRSSITLVALLAAGTAWAQTGSLDRSSEMLDAMMRRLKLCAEITDAAARLACYDRIESGAAPMPGGAPLPGTAPPVGAARPPAPMPTPATPPPGPMPDPSRVGKDDKPVPAEDRAFDPRAQRGPGTTVGAAPGVQLPGQGSGTVEPQWRRVGAVPMSSVPGSRVPVVTLELPGLRPGPDYRWQLSMALANNTPRAFDVTIACSFRNGDRVVSQLTVILRNVRGGEKVAADINGPPTHQFVDNAPCHIVAPLQ